MDKTKKCSRCKKVKSVTLEFYLRGKSRPGQYTSRCKVCIGKTNQEWKVANPARFRERTRAWQARQSDVLKMFLLQYLLAHPCVDCGEDDVSVLEFDHIRGKKTADVMHLVLGSCAVKTLFKEIRKCEVRCANCHKRKTIRSEKSWRLASMKQKIPRPEVLK